MRFAPGALATIILLFVISVIAMIVSFTLAMQKNDFLRQRVDQQDLVGAIKEGATRYPDIELRSYYGSASAPITVVFALDLTSDGSRQAYLDHIDYLLSTADAGQSRLYHKYFLPKEEFDFGHERFNSSVLAYCLSKLSPNNTVQIHKDLLNSAGGSESLASKYSVNAASLALCTSDSGRAALIRDSIETDSFSLTAPSIAIGIDGQDFTILSGNPNQDLLARRLKDRMIRVGI